MKTLIVLLFLVGVLLSVTAACSNSNLSFQLSEATSDAQLNKGVIVYAGYAFELTRVKIDGVDYIANSKGGIVVVPRN